MASTACDDGTREGEGKIVASHIVLVRHGATEWSESGRHTGRTDIPLTDEGRTEAVALGERLRPWTFALVLTSPKQRAIETARLAGLGDRAAIDEHLREWDYGDYEGRTTIDIRNDQPGWTIWNGVCPNGETAESVGQRADQTIARADEVQGPVALFSHGHFLRVLAARWLGLTPLDGRYFALRTATISVLGYERETRVLERWDA
jgi:probable phosphoglycerate mutase